MNIFIKLLLLSMIVSCTYSQSTSVLDANLFKENITPPLKIGKGFHINDVYKQTKTCFTVESSNKNALNSHSNGRNSILKLFYAKSNEEYNLFKSKGGSGKINFLNLYSAGGAYLDEHFSSSNIDVERLIFYQSVDFGLFSFDNEPTLLPEAKILIDQKKFDEFIKYYGTHYVSGVRRESSLYVILTKDKKNSISGHSSNANFEGSANIPIKGSGSIEVQSQSTANTFFDDENITVSIEIKGPSFDKSGIENSIKEIITGNSNDKVSAIASLVGGIANNISDVNQSKESQYYYSPFELYGIEGIHWDEKKQNQLIKINEQIIKLHTFKNQINNEASEIGVMKLKDEMKNLKDANKNPILIPDKYIEEILNKFRSCIPGLKRIIPQIEQKLKILENIYINCSDYKCDNMVNCCNLNELMIIEQDFDVNKLIIDEFKPLYNYLNIDLKNEISSKNNCEIYSTGKIIITNTSKNPYEIIINNIYEVKLNGYSKIELDKPLGKYLIKATQLSGYMMYPTVNNRAVEIKNICGEAQIKIGYED